MKSTINEVVVDNTDDKKKVHRWRLCPIGMHYVREHLEHTPPSKKHPTGEVVIRHAHCAKNPLGKNKHEIRDILSLAELTIIAKSSFSDLKGPGGVTFLL